jgi:hypothetical protein
MSSSKCSDHLSTNSLLELLISLFAKPHVCNNISDLGALTNLLSLITSPLDSIDECVDNNDAQIRKEYPICGFPLKNGKGLLIDMDLGIIMLPMVVSGVSIGVIANIYLSSFLIISCYALFLVLIGIQLFLKAYGLY